MIKKEHLSELIILGRLISKSTTRGGDRVMIVVMIGVAASLIARDRQSLLTPRSCQLTPLTGD
jgi:hypothetical protein